MLTIFHYDFMVRAFIAGIIIAVLAPAIGIFLVVRRYSLLADTLSHVSLVGVAGGVFFNFNPIAGALIASTLAAFGMEKLRERGKIFGESILALFLSGSLAIALILLGLSHGLNVNIFSYLFGSITTVTRGDLWIIGIFGALVLAATAALFRRFFLASYDEELARAGGLPVNLLNITLMVLAAVTVSLSMRVVGILLIGALMVIPVLAAMQLAKSFSQTLKYAVAFSLISVIAGLFLSFYLNLPSGGTIVACALILFGASLLKK
ncbi:MAG TPA: metal ABC transporter permease [Patescibacteria group bacterium]|nr:metal ABC transporter permease [Patescibacteria group bacterium]